MQYLNDFGVDKSKIKKLKIQIKKESYINLASLFSYLMVILIVVYAIYEHIRFKKKSSINRIGASQPLAQGEIPDVTFNDIGGCTEAKRELQSIAEFFRNQEDYADFAADIPSNVLLSGPPGTGKTTLAKALASEIGISFYEFSGSQFVEIYVGVGASRVRELFENAKKNKPSVIFVDEVDSVARKRGNSIQSSREHDQTLDQFLVELDGFTKQKKGELIFIAATNREDVLDPAFLQRMNRKIEVPLPDYEGRQKILNVLVQKSAQVRQEDIQELARLSTNYSGRELANLIREARRMNSERLINEAKQFCLDRRDGNETKTWISGPMGKMSQPVLLSGQCRKKGTVQISIGETEWSTKDTNGDGVWSRFLHLAEGSYTAEIDQDNDDAPPFQFEFKVKPELKEIPFSDFKMALDRLGTPVPQIESAKNLMNALDKKVFSQKVAKMVLSAAAIAHYAHSRVNFDQKIPRGIRSSILLSGPKGVGKTFLAKSLAEELRVPFCEVDATSFTGGNMRLIGQGLLEELLRDGKGEEKRVEHGIICVKNMDKIGIHSDLYINTLFQRSLVEYLLGKVVDVDYESDRFSSKKAAINTRDIFMIFEGEFKGIDKVVQKRLRMKKNDPKDLVGSRLMDDEGRNLFRDDEENKLTLLSEVESIDLKDYGIIPELISCISTVVVLDEFQKDDYLSTLNENQDHSPLQQYIEILSYQGIKIEVTGSARQELAHESMKRNLGVPGLRSLLHQLYLYLVYQESSESEVTVVESYAI